MYKNEYLEICLKERDKGNIYLVKGYMYTRKRELEYLVINDLGFMTKYSYALYELKNEIIKAGIKEFILTESSSTLMQNIHGLNEVNIKIKCLKKIKYIDKQTNEEIVKDGLLMEVVE